MDLNIIKTDLLDDFRERIKFNPLENINKMKEINIPVDYFQFYKSISSVYSSKIEGEDIDFDSYYKHKFLKVKFKHNYTKKADDLFLAYDFIEKKPLNFDNVKIAHSLLSSNLLPKSQQRVIRTNPMFVINSDDLIEYVAADPKTVKYELEKLFQDIKTLLEVESDSIEIFYFASFIHLLFVKIHPFQDGNGRTARLLEKWFLIEKFGIKASAIQLEKNYFKNIKDYYLNIKKIGLKYELLDYQNSLDFLLMTIESIKTTPLDKKSS